jgi:hypothetical protein
MKTINIGISDDSRKRVVEVLKKLLQILIFYTLRNILIIGM